MLVSFCFFVVLYTLAWQPSMPMKEAQNVGDNQTRTDQRFAMWQEDVLRTEIRALRTTVLRVNQWGVTVLASIETALYFIRRDVLEHLRIEKPSVSALPADHYLRGTLFLLLVAVLFFLIGMRGSVRITGYRKELKRLQVSKIAEKDIRAGLINVPAPCGASRPGKSADRKTA